MNRTSKQHCIALLQLAITGLASLLLSALSSIAAEPLPVGKSAVDVQFGDISLKLFAYKPESFREGPLLMVFHGVLRNAEEYRDHSIAMGDRFGALVVSPLFDDKSFPSAKYQLGGIVVDGKATSPEERTGEYVNRIAREIRQREGREKMPYSLIGHSGGGQFLVRLAAFVPTEAGRIVAANPGTHTFPTLQAEFPYGFGGLPAELQTDEVLRKYLAQPLTIYVGALDVERDEYLSVRPASDAQGLNRFERGQNAFAAAKALADENKWPFGWQLVIAEGIEHDHEKMFNHETCAAALGWKPAK